MFGVAREILNKKLLFLKEKNQFWKKKIDLGYVTPRPGYLWVLLQFFSHFGSEVWPANIYVYIVYTDTYVEIYYIDWVFYL